jgi:hypothetical protein
MLKCQPALLEAGIALSDNISGPVVLQMLTSFALNIALFLARNVDCSCKFYLPVSPTNNNCTDVNQEL